MPLISLILVLVVVGVLLWALNQFVPMQPQVKTILNAVIVIVLILWILQVFGLLGPIGRVRLG